MSLVDVLALVILNFRTWLEIKLTYVGYGPYNAKILRSWERKGRIGHYTQKNGNYQVVPECLSDLHCLPAHWNPCPPPQEDCSIGVLEILRV